MPDRFRKAVGRAIESPFVSWMANAPPFSWLVKAVARRVVKRELGQAQVVASRMHDTTAGLVGTLQEIAEDVVDVLGYTGAMVAPFEHGELAVRARYIDPRVASMDQIREWEAQLSQWTERPVSITDPEVARVHVLRDRENLSVQAYEQGVPVISTELYSLFAPVVPPAAKPVVQVIQRALGIDQVIAVPFFLETDGDDGSEARAGQARKGELVGNLFAAKGGEISEQDQRVLAAFARQAAAAIESEQRRIRSEVVRRLIREIQAHLADEAQILQRIAEGVVNEMGYVGAMVATAEPDGSLPSRVLYVDPAAATMEQIREWENEIAQWSAEPVSITDPDIARVYVNDERYEDNLGVAAYKAGTPVTSDELFRLFTPIAPPASRPVVEAIQERLGIHKVIAVPFFLGGEFVGNLFGITRSDRFSSRELDLLRAFGLQAAIGIRNARLYRRSEERREAAQLFGKMAFTSAAYVHELRNHIGIFRVHLHLSQMEDALTEEDRQKLVDKVPEILQRLDRTADILDYLHEPWRDMPDELMDANECLVRALGKVFPAVKLDPTIVSRGEGQVEDGITLHVSLSQDQLVVNTSPDMLTEAFRVVVKNAAEAVRERHAADGLGHIWVTSDLDSRSGDLPIVVSVRDNGTGIRPENQSKLFEIRWSTKGGRGMGFGLFWTSDYLDGMGGSIRADSTWGEGTTFTIGLPRYVQSDVV